MKAWKSRAARGFTLIEIAVATAIIAIGVLALLVAVGSGTRINASGRELTQAAFLAQEIREWTLRLPYSDKDPADMYSPPGPDGSNPQSFVDDLDDLMGTDGLGTTYAPPRSAENSGAPAYLPGTQIADMIGWSQVIKPTYRNTANLTQVVSPGPTDVMHIGVEIYKDGRLILQTGWLVTRSTQP